MNLEQHYSLEQKKMNLEMEHRSRLISSKRQQSAQRITFRPCDIFQSIP